MRFGLVGLLFTFFIAAQPPGGPGSTGTPGGSGTNSNPSHNVSASRSHVDAPMGTNVTLDCSHDGLTDPQYQWEHSCTESQLWAIPADWDTQSISECVPNAETREYKINVSGTNSRGQAASGTASTTITFHEPDLARLYLGLVRLDGTLYWEQEFRVTLEWNGMKLGPCAQVCCQERVRVKHEQSSAFKWLDHFQDWWPTCAQQTSGNGVQGSRYNETSWHWRSPNLKDLQFTTMDAPTYQYFQTLLPGTRIATKEHTYKFSGNSCVGAWTMSVTKQFELVVGGAPGNKFPEWRIMK